MTQAAIAPAPIPLCELPAAALQVAAAFAGVDDGLDHVSVRQGDEGEVIVTGCSRVMCAEVFSPGQATSEILLPIRPLRQALRRLPAEHASVVLGEHRLATLRLYAEDSTLAVSMPLAAEPGVRMPAVAPGEQAGQLAISGAVLAAASARLACFGVLDVARIGCGWLLSGETEGMRLRCVVAGVQRE